MRQALIYFKPTRKFFFFFSKPTRMNEYFLYVPMGVFLYLGVVSLHGCYNKNTAKESPKKKHVYQGLSKLI